MSYNEKIRCPNGSHYSGFLCVFLILFMGSCGTDAIDDQLPGTFSFQTLEEVEVFEFRQFDGRLFAGTRQGLHVMDPGRRLQVRESFKTDARVRTFLILSDDFWLISASFGDREFSDIYKSSDQGRSWTRYGNGYGGDQKWIPTTLDAVQDNPSVIFARTAPFTNVARSTDGGHSWESVVLTWDSPNLGNSKFVKIDPSDESRVWAGGASAYFTPMLIMSEDGGDSWKGFELADALGVIWLEATVFDIAIHPVVSSRVIIGMGGVIRTGDDGDSWEVISTENSISVLTNSPGDTGVVYASGLHPSGKLAISITPDFGDTWETFVYEEGPDDVMVNDLSVALIDGSEFVFLGTNQGIFSFRVE